MAEKSFSLCVYCGSRPGSRPAYLGLAQALGRSVAKRGWQLVYGGGCVGLMGAVADAALSAGARVVGVIPESLMRPEVGHAGLTEMHVVQTMHQRKQMMAELSDAFVAMPGGIGTFEELFEVWTWRHLGYHDRPIGLLDVDGYWSGLTAFVRRACDEGFMDQHQLSMVHTGADVELMLDWLASNFSGSSASSYSQI